MFEKVNFFPVQYIVTILGLVVGITVFREMIYSFFSSNPTINGIIVFLFFFNIFWLTGVLAYFSRSSKTVYSIALIDQNRRSINRTSGENSDVEVGRLNVPIVGTVIDTPAMSNAIARLDRRSKLEISKEEYNMVMATANENINKALAFSRFLGGIFTMLGLFGTFVGLLQTITGVGNAFAGLAQGGVQVGDLILSLAEPLQGMATAFSTSLFGLVASLFSGYLIYIAGQRAKAFTSRLSNYLTSRIPIRNYGLSDLSSTSSMETLIEILETGFSSLLGGENKGIGGYGGDAIEASSSGGASGMRNITPGLGGASSFGGYGGAGAPGGPGTGGMGGGALDYNSPMAMQQGPQYPGLGTIAGSQDSGMRMELLVAPLQNLSRSIDVMNASIYRFLSDTNSLFSEALSGITELQSYSLDVYTRMLDSMAAIEQSVRDITSDIPRAEVAKSLARLDSGLRSVYDVQAFVANKTSDLLSISEQYLPVVAQNTSNTVEGLAYVSDQITNNFNVTMGYMDSTTSALNQLVGYNNYIAESLDNANSALSTIYDGLGSMFGSLENILGTLGQTNSLINVNNDKLQTAIELIDGVGSVLMQVSSSLNNLENITTTGFATLNNTVIAGVNHISTDLARITQNIYSVQNEISNGFQTMKEGFEASLTGLSSIHSQIIAGNKNDNKFYALMENTSASIDKATSACAYILNNIYSNTTENVELLSNILSTSNDISSKVATNEDIIRVQGLVASFASQTLETSMAINNTIKAVTGALHEKLHSILEVDQGILTGSINAVEEHNDLMRALGAMFKGSQERLSKLTEMHTTLEEANALSRGAINGLAESAQSLSTAIDNISEEVADMSSIVRNSLNYESILDNLVENVGDLGRYIGDLGSDIVALSQSFDAKEDMTEAIIEAMGSVRDLEGGLSAFASGVTDMSDLLAQAVPVLGSIADAGDYASDIRNLVEGLVTDMDSLLSGFSGIANDMFEIATNVERGVENMSFETSEAYIIDMSEALSHVSKMMEDALSLLPEINDTILNNVDYRDLLEVMREEISDLASSVSSLTDSIEDSVADVSEFFGDGMSDTVRLIEENVADLATAVEEMANVVLSGADLESGLGNVTDTMSVVGDLIEDLINTLADVQHTAVAALETQQDNVALLDSLDQVNSNLEDVSRGLYDNSVREEVEEVIDLANAMNRSLQEVSESIRENSSLSAESATVMLPLIETVVGSVVELNDKLTEATQVLGADTGLVSSMMEEMAGLVQEVAVSMREMGNTIRNTDVDSLHDLVEGIRDMMASVDQLTDNLTRSVSVNIAGAQNSEIMIELLSEIRAEMMRGGSNDNLGAMLQANLDNVVRELTGAVRSIKSSGNNSREAEKVLRSIDNLREVYNEGNARMDVVANALDAVITEMLNSREITESILRSINR